MYVSRLAASPRAGTAAVLAVAAAVVVSATNVSGASLELRFSRPLPETTFLCPVRVGIPIAPGRLTDGSNARLLADGREIDLQSEVLARYNDRTVKWLLLDFQAPPTSKLTLEFGPGVRPKAPRKPIRVADEAKGITVDTGRLKATIRRKGQGFPDELYLDLNADGRYAEDERLAASGPGRSNWMDFVHTPTIRSREVLSAAATKAEPDASTVEIERLEAETVGPLHAVVKVSGKYRYRHVGTTARYPYAHPQYRDKMPKEVGRIPFVMRLHFYRGLGVVEVQHTFIYEGDPDRDFAGSLAVAAPMPVSAEGVVTLGTGDKPLSFRRGRAQQAGLSQTSADHFRIWRRLGGRPSGTLHAGARAPGWLDVSGRRWGVTAAIWRSWQNYPKGLHADFSSGRLKAFLWPPEAGLMDLRRYTRQWGVSETGARDGVDPFAVSRHASRGVAKTHRVLFDFHPASRKPAEVASRVSWFRQKPYAWPSAEHMCRTRSQVALAFSPAEAGKYDELEKTINRCLDYMLFSREHFRWYGMFDYGDLQQCFQNVHPHGRWESDYGRWGWFNGDASSHKPPAALLTHFLRTGRRDIFDLFEAEVLHVIDVDMVNAEEYPWNNEGYRDMRGCTHRHNGQHWACFFVGSRGIQALW
ncbi:MAG: exo-rhamnogalacturonan lyase family protein, partial [Planctomycetota bacterium]